MKKHVCTMCGCNNEDVIPTKHCSLHKAPREKNVESAPVKTPWDNEHRVGIAKGVDPKIVDELNKNFMEKCTEIALYLAMGRQADREGFPEIADALIRIANEEADHSSKLAELLGHSLTSSTKKNLENRVNIETDNFSNALLISKRAKDLNLESIYQIVHEMCKDEARHKSIFKGLLKHP